MSDLRHDPVAPAASDRAQDLGFGPMDRVHGEFDALLQRAATCPEAELPGLLAEVDAHLREHFALEDGWMRETEFPPRDCHIDEHAAVLKSSGEVLALAQAGDLRHARGFLAELARWFPGHADYLDSALAHWMCKRQFGGKPVVLHRRSAERS